VTIGAKGAFDGVLEVKRDVAGKPTEVGAAVVEGEGEGEDEGCLFTSSSPSPPPSPSNNFCILSISVSFYSRTHTEH